MKWTAKIEGREGVLFDPRSDTLSACVAVAVREPGSEGQRVVVFKQLKGDREPRRDRSFEVYRQRAVPFGA